MNSAETMKKRRELLQALHKLPNDDKVAYLEAVFVASHVVNTESNPAAFLQVFQSSLKAAEKLAKYWALRKEVFGDRAFLPIRDTSGNGALTLQDLGFCAKLNLVQLPDDAQGRPVQFINPENVALKASNPAISKAVFWFTDNNVKNPVAQLLGTQSIRLVRPETCRRTSENFRQAMTRLLAVFPIKERIAHLCCISRPETRKSARDVVIPLYLRTFNQDAQVTPVVHVASSGSEMMQRLTNHGFVSEGIPVALGGTWTEESCVPMESEEAKRFPRDELGEQDDRKRQKRAHSADESSTLALREAESDHATVDPEIQCQMVKTTGLNEHHSTSMGTSKNSSNSTDMTLNTASSTDPKKDFQTPQQRGKTTRLHEAQSTALDLSARKSRTSCMLEALERAREEGRCLSVLDVASLPAVKRLVGGLWDTCRTNVSSPQAPPATTEACSVDNSAEYLRRRIKQAQEKKRQLEIVLAGLRCGRVLHEKHVPDETPRSDGLLSLISEAVVSKLED